MSAIYLYCLARPAALPAVTGPGVEGGGPPEVIPFRDVVAIVSAVETDDFLGQEAEARMRDLAWVGPRACRHEEVIERVMRGSPVVPARLATLFSSRERLAAWLETHHATISQALDRFADHDEWAIKGTLDRSLAETRLLALTVARQGGVRSPSPGARYFEERRLRAGVNQELGAWLNDVAADLAKALHRHAPEFRERRVVNGGASDDSRVLNWAFLVSRRRVDDFRAEVGRLNAVHAEHGLVLDLSGPWPPYSFCPSLE